MCSRIPQKALESEQRVLGSAAPCWFAKQQICGEGRGNPPRPSEEWARAAFPVVLNSSSKPSKKCQQLKILLGRFRNVPVSRKHFPSWGFGTFSSPLVSPLCLYQLQSTWPRLVAGWNLLQFHFSDHGVRAVPQTSPDQVWSLRSLQRKLISLKVYIGPKQWHHKGISQLLMQLS